MPGTIHAISECVKIHSAQLNVLQAFNAPPVETSWQ